MQPGVDLLHEDGPVFVFNKSAGLATQAPAGIDSLEVRAKDWLREREQKTGNVYLAVLHRLDRPVSGAIVFARHVRAARRIAEQFETRQVGKTYWACVTGVVAPDSGTWLDTMRKIPNVAQAEVVPADHPEAQEAVLHYKTLGQTPHGSLLEIELETGRMHQIRLQAATRGHPILGDALYGSTVPFGEQHEDLRLRAIALHARSLRFRHPMHQGWVECTAPLSADWQAFGLT